MTISKSVRSDKLNKNILKKIEMQREFSTFFYINSD